MARTDRGAPPRLIRLVTTVVCVAAVGAALVILVAKGATSTGGDPHRPATGMEVGIYAGHFSYDAYRSLTGSYPGVETTYLNADQVSTPDIAEHEAEIVRGISPVITLDHKDGPFTRGQIAAWGDTVQSYYRRFVAGLRTLSDFAAAQHNGTRVYFADEHEAEVKIAQHKYSTAIYGALGVPTVADSAAAWNRVMAYVSRAAPAVVRVYWYSGTGTDEDTFADALDASLIQMATIDPYRWAHDTLGDTPTSLWGATVAHLKSAPWMRRADGSLKPWGVTEWGTDVSLGDAANARFVTEALRFFRVQGAAFAVYFDRVDGNDRSNDFVITAGDQPRTLAAFRAAADGR